VTNVSLTSIFWCYKPSKPFGDWNCLAVQLWARHAVYGWHNSVVYLRISVWLFYRPVTILLEGRTYM